MEEAGESTYVVSGTEDSPNPIIFTKDPEVTEFSYEEAPVFTLIELLAKNMGLNYIIALNGDYPNK